MVVFSDMEKGIIRNMMLSKSHRDIARIIDCSVDQVASIITEEIAGTDTITHQMKLDATKPPKKTKPPKPPKQVLQEKKLSATQKRSIEKQRIADQKQQRKLEAYRVARDIEIEKKKRRPSNYKTIEVDYTKKIMVKIDHTTYIYSVPGQEEKTKRDFLKNYKKPIDRFTK